MLVGRHDALDRRRKSMHSFKSVVKVVEGVSATSHAGRYAPLVHGAPLSAGDIWDRVADEQVVQVVGCLLALYEPYWNGHAYRAEVAASVRNVVHLALVCRRFASVLHTMASREQAEVIARNTVTSIPHNPETFFAFTNQVCDELQSAEQRQMLKHAHNAMACHCADACCGKLQKAFNKDLRNGDVLKLPKSPRLAPRKAVEHRMVSVLSNCLTLAVNEEGTHAYAVVQRSGIWHVIKLVQHRADQNNCVWFEQEACSESFISIVALFPGGEPFEVGISQPLFMSAASDGSGVAYVVTLTSNELEVPYSAAVYWDGTSGKTKSVPIDTEASSYGIEDGCINAQAVWFLSPEADDDCMDAKELQLVVAWSTEYYQPKSFKQRHLGSSASSHLGPGFLFATYAMDGGIPKLVERTCFMSLGRMREVHPLASGREALVVSEHRHGLGFTFSICDIVGDKYTIVQGIGGMSASFVSSCISPMGDCIAVIERGAVSAMTMLSLHERADYQTYQRVNCIDVTEWFRNGSGGIKAYADRPRSAPVAPAFSPCGRFVTIIDSGPSMGDIVMNHGVVIVDTAMRRGGHNSLRARPLFESAEQAPRELHWTRSGIWMLPPGTDGRGRIGAQGGALCLFAPRPLSLS
tara:strand:+ start:5702 stop:7609 length:1908 start_codon:yes stop_codon:yes gene_type:complete